MKMLVVLAAVLLTVASIPREAFGQPEIATWDKDMDKGGDVVDFEAWITETNRTGKLAVIRGRCWSACAIKLGAKKVCIYPSATIHFHGIHYKGSLEVLHEDNKLFIATFPLLIQQWIKDNKAMDSVERHVVLTGSTAIQLGIPDCTLVLPVTSYSPRP